MGGAWGRRLAVLLGRSGGQKDDKAEEIERWEEVLRRPREHPTATVDADEEGDVSGA